MKLGIGIVSAGKVGTVLGAALARAGHTIVGVHAPSDEAKDRAEAMLGQVPHRDVEDIVRTCELVILALPGDQITPLVTGLASMNAWQPGQLVVHTCPYLGSDALSPAAAAGALTLAIHPAMTFTGTSLDLDRLSGTPFAISGPQMILPIAHALVGDMGGVPFEVDDAQRATYHAGLMLASEHASTLLDRARRVLEDAGVTDPAVLASGATSAMDAVLRGHQLQELPETVGGELGELDQKICELLSDARAEIIERRIVRD